MSRILAAHRGRRRAMSMTEMVIVAGLFSLVGGLLVTIVLATARQTSYAVDMLPAESGIYRAIEQARMQLLAGEGFSTRLVNDGQGIVFHVDANPAGQLSALAFVPDPPRLVFVPDRTEPNTFRVLARDVTGSFALDESVGRVTIVATQVSRGPRRTEIINRLEETLVLRN